MKAFVIHASASGVPCKSAAMAGMAMAGPVKLSGMHRAARQTAASTKARRAGEAGFIR